LFAVATNPSGGFTTNGIRSNGNNSSAQPTPGTSAGAGNSPLWPRRTGNCPMSCQPIVPDESA
jgi:hypothetical protein